MQVEVIENMGATKAVEADWLGTPAASGGSKYGPVLNDLLMDFKEARDRAIADGAKFRPIRYRLFVNETDPRTALANMLRTKYADAHLVRISGPQVLPDGYQLVEGEYALYVTTQEALGTARRGRPSGRRATADTAA